MAQIIANPFKYFRLEEKLLRTVNSWHKLLQIIDQAGESSHRVKVWAKSTHAANEASSSFTLFQAQKRSKHKIFTNPVGLYFTRTQNSQNENKILFLKIVLMHVVTTVCVFVFVRVCVCVCVCMFIPGLIFNTWFPAPFILPILVLLLFLLLLVLIVQLTAFVSKRLAAPNLKECEWVWGRHLGEGEDASKL